MFGDLLNLVIFVVIIFLIFKMFVKGVLPGVFDALAIVFKIALVVVMIPFNLIFGVIRTITGMRNDDPVGVERETITITDSFKDKKGRTVRVNKTINVGSRYVTKRDLDRIR